MVHRSWMVISTARCGKIGDVKVRRHACRPVRRLVQQEQKIRFHKVKLGRILQREKLETKEAEEHVRSGNSILINEIRLD